MLTISGREPTLLRISDKLSIRYVKLGEGPALVPSPHHSNTA